MPRSVKKGPYIDYKLLDKIQKMNETSQKKIVKTTRIFRGHPGTKAEKASKSK